MKKILWMTSLMAIFLLGPFSVFSIAVKEEKLIVKIVSFDKDEVTVQNFMTDKKQKLPRALFQVHEPILANQKIELYLK